MSSSKQLEIAGMFAGVARDFACQPDADAVDRRIETTVSTVLGCPWVQVVHLTERGTLSFPEPKEPALRAVLRISAESREGVVSETITGQEPIVVHDMAEETRWPHYTARVCTETEVRSAVSFPLTLGTRQLGTLSAFSPVVGFFDEEKVGIAAVMAEHASVALSHASCSDRANNLEIALMTNRKIGVAIGVLMARSGVTDQQAFDLLRVTSQHCHVKLRDIAEYVVMTGELPTDGSEDVLPRSVLPA